ncbi:hypothetical protein NEMBOFW57_009718 [Staphylotrichum longicolle]|uniref:Uncharacterized protein n=1 Tax=Staphylotrichum longicolle TaxID=669026 RepID=A0AAD4ETJ9_9PEZI|nr:hypothetical protein NEMBOFW57_009718 [Staphylotrichum longicolle]
MPRTPKSAAAADNAGEGQPSAMGAYKIGEVPVSQTDLKFPDIDFGKVAAVLGLQKEKSAYERWRLLRHKFNLVVPEKAAAAKTPGRAGGKKATPAKISTAAADNNDDDDDGEEEEEEAKPAPTLLSRRRHPPLLLLLLRGRRWWVDSSDEEEEKRPAKKAKGKERLRLLERRRNYGVKDMDTDRNN